MGAARERPIPFTGSQVRAILDGRQTQTRRVVKPQPRLEGRMWVMPEPFGAGWSDRIMSVPAVPGHSLATRNPYGQPGDRLWVRETWGYDEESPNDGTPFTYRWVHYRATPHHGFRVQPDRAACTYWHESVSTDEAVRARRWHPSIHMPRWASRLTLEITGVRVERVQAISADNAIAEGFACLSKDGGRINKYGIPDRDGLPGRDNFGWAWEDWRISPIDAFEHLWDSLAKPYTRWADNPWVWVIEFRRVA